MSRKPVLEKMLVFLLPFLRNNVTIDIEHQLKSIGENRKRS